MVKKGAAVDGDPASKVTAELKRLMTAILVEEKDEFVLDAIDRAKEVLFTLKDLKASETASLRLDDSSLSFPEEFRCPLSKQLMRDPVVVATGQTYDRPFIQKWLKSGNRTCPRTQQVLSHTMLIPNHLIKGLISQWCQNRRIKFPDRQSESLNREDGLILNSDRDHFFSLLDKISSPSITDQKAAAKELRLLTKRIPTFRALFGESTNYILQLLKPLTNQNSTLNQTQLDLQEDLITTLLNLSIHESNKKLVAETPAVIPLLIQALRCGTIETKSNAAATLFTLSALDSNKALIGELRALKPLIELLNDVGNNPSAVKDAASAIFNLCILHENKARAVNEGAIKVLLDKIKNGIVLDELLAILAMLSSHHKAVEEMSELGVLPCLVRILRETSCARNKENCIAILYVVCMNDRAKLREIRAEENEYGTLSNLARDGTSRAKRKANGILEKLNRALHFVQVFHLTLKQTLVSTNLYHDSIVISLKGLLHIGGNALWRPHVIMTNHGPQFDSHEQINRIIAPVT
ncbi:hypothetical protein V2J09_004945 [Rumex salicifolius]